MKRFNIHDIDKETHRSTGSDPAVQRDQRHHFVAGIPEWPAHSYFCRKRAFSLPQHRRRTERGLFCHRTGARETETRRAGLHFRHRGPQLRSRHCGSVLPERPVDRAHRRSSSLVAWSGRKPVHPSDASLPGLYKERSDPAIGRVRRGTLVCRQIDQ